MTKKYWVIAGALTILIIGSLWYQKSSSSIAEPLVVASSTPESLVTASSTAAALVKTDVSKPVPLVIKKFPINPLDTIVSWSFKGTYLESEALIQKATASNVKLTGLIGKGKYSDYDLYVGIGNNDIYLGDGAGAYENYNHSISMYPDRGLAYANLGHLMEELGAYHTAADAFAKAVAVEPGIQQYRTSQIDFLETRFPEEAAKLKANQ